MSDGAGEAAGLRPPIPIEGSYHLFSEREVAEFIGSVGVVRFMEDLVVEIDAVYNESGLAGAPRNNIRGDSADKGRFATEEIMTCSSSDYTVMKRIGSDPGRAAKGRDTVYGAMYANETGSGQLRLLCAAAELTALRTAATSALVLSHLNPRLETLSIVGVGAQGQKHALAIADLSPRLNRILLRDVDRSTAEQSADKLQGELDANLSHRPAIRVEGVAEKDRRVESESDAIVTATFGLERDAPALAPLSLSPDTVIAAVGADMPGKRELDRITHMGARFVTDELRQGLHEGELQHTAAELDIFGGHVEKMRFSDYHGWLAGGRVIGIPELLDDPEAFNGRAEPFTVYDSTGFAGQDLAAARVMLRLLKDKDYPMQPQFNAGPDITLSQALGHGQS